MASTEIAPEACCKCGAIEGVGCELVEESTSLLSRKKYCPTCRYRYRRRVNLVVFGILLLLAAGSGWRSIAKSENVLSSGTVRWTIIFVLQWLMLIPHELGHAITARLLGFTSIRILIGSGQPLWSGEWLGFRWLFNRYPLGGFTLTDNAGATRWGLFLMVAAGPAVSIVVMVLIMLFRRADAFSWPDTLSFSGLLFWANGLVLAENLAPFRFHSSYGWMENDGLLLLRILGAERVIGFLHADLAPEGKIGNLMRKIGVGLLAGLSLLLAGLGIFIVLSLHRDGSYIGIPFGVLFFALAVYVLTLMPRVLKSSANRKNRELKTPVGERGRTEIFEASEFKNDQDFLSLWNSEIEKPNPQSVITLLEGRLISAPKDPLLLVLKGERLMVAEDYSGAEATFLSIHTDPLPLYARWLVAAALLACAFYRGEIERAELECDRALASSWPDELKVAFLDQLVCSSLYDLKLPHLERMEKWARRALEIAPNDPGIRGTMGALLVELGRLTEGEEFLKTVENGRNLREQGVAGFYLGLVRMAQGQRAEGKRLIQQALIYNDAPWLVERAKAKLVGETKL